MCVLLTDTVTVSIEEAIVSNQRSFQCIVVD